MRHNEQENEETFENNDVNQNTIKKLNSIKITEDKKKMDTTALPLRRHNTRTAAGIKTSEIIEPGIK